MLSIDSLGLILETSYSCQLSDLSNGAKLLRVRVYKEDDWQQIEISAYVWQRLKARYPYSVEKWVNNG